MPRKKTIAPAPAPAPEPPKGRRISVPVDAFEEPLKQACLLADRNEADLARLAIRAVVELILREERLVTPTVLTYAERKQAEQSPGLLPDRGL